MTDTSEGILQNARNLFARWHAFQSHVGPYRERVRKSGIEFDLLSALAPTEMQLSRMFADFLNPEGSHGQGAVFLQALLDYVWPSVTDYLPSQALLSEIQSAKFADFLKSNGIQERGADFLKVLLKYVSDSLTSGEKPHVSREIQSAKVDVEYGIEGSRRIDITIKAKFSATESIWIGIENKPWAIEQKDQLKDYCIALTINNKVPIVLFWHGFGRDSLTTGGEKGIINMSYVTHDQKLSVVGWLKICRGLTRAPEVWQGLSMLERYIEANFFNEVKDDN